MLTALYPKEKWMQKISRQYQKKGRNVVFIDRPNILDEGRVWLMPVECDTCRPSLVAFYEDVVSAFFLRFIRYSLNGWNWLWLLWKCSKILWPFSTATVKFMMMWWGFRGSPLTFHMRGVVHSSASSSGMLLLLVSKSCFNSRKYILVSFGTWFHSHRLGDNWYITLLYKE